MGRACTILKIFFKKNQLSCLEYFSKKSTLKKILPYNYFFDIQMRARARAHKNKKKIIFLCARPRACTILRIFLKKKSTFILRIFFKKVNFEKNLTLQFFLIFKCAHSRARAHKDQKKVFSFFLCAPARVYH